MDSMIDYFKSSLAEVFDELKTSEKGLPEEEVQKRLKLYGLNRPVVRKEKSIPAQILSRFMNPLVVVLLIIAGFSLFFGEQISALLVLMMAVLSVFLSFFQEYRAGKEAEKLREMVRTTATVVRGGRPREVKLAQIVRGDIVDLSAGDMVPADIRIISCKDLFVNQASLTGESLPVEKCSDDPLANAAYMGSSIVSGTAMGVVVKTGLATRFGEMASAIVSAPPPTSFDKGINEFTWLMIRFMSVLVVFIFVVNFFLKGNLLESFLFAIAVAVGLTPEMLPMIVTVNLSRGAMAMAKKEVIVKRLSSIQNFGAMDVLCTDKTGTLTLDKIVLEKHCDVKGREDQSVLVQAYINSYYQTGLKNLLDKAILKYEKLLVKQFKKIDEIPFDFQRRIMSVVVDYNAHHRLIAKGAPEEIFARCDSYELDGALHPVHPSVIEELKKEYDSLSAEGFRVLAVAYKDVEKSKTAFTREDEKALVLKGYVAFLDPPKPSAKEAIAALRKMGVELKILTGDNELVTRKICSEIELDIQGLAGPEAVDQASDPELKDLVNKTTIFVRLNPAQKERIIIALQRENRTVGFLGDGINDGAALRVADVGISVNNAADIAKELADIILLRKSLRVLKDAVMEGRKTFGNITKYVKMGASSNFGNMLSMTGATLFLPFLPMLPIQILLNNFLYDLSQVGVPSDEVDNDYTLILRLWNLKLIKYFMVIIGPVSSIFDFATFGMMLFIFHASQPLFHTGWFLESLTTQTLVIYVIRTGKVPFIESWPSLFLMLTSILIVTAGFGIVFSPLAAPLGFVVPPLLYFVLMFLMVAVYLYLVQIVKVWFIRKFGFD
ncbi:MAG: magnesium-translocating P-type ATPase [Candidatus Margulisbacteria bacterium]|nr:magnesium-translocating P-type ATPase [Candidatus Margulisiibacteriota bacterium]